ncbi:hypothetical protein E2C01_079825 [Portunus trituberculatus]|uniref:Uncharacterized protein n=1 Tax=Portunus trituberculatus TaxID=210409 RepID=A0A5B7ITU1_PORTR|nr:hypothetical protein [Portunus trituberculatus]
MALFPLGTPDYPGTAYRKGKVDTVGGDRGTSIRALFNKTRCVPAIEVLSCLAAEERFMRTVSLRFIVAKYRESPLVPWGSENGRVRQRSDGVRGGTERGDEDKRVGLKGCEGGEGLWEALGMSVDRRIRIEE